MPAKLTPTMTFAFLRYTCWYTEARLLDEPDTRPFAGRVAGWLDAIAHVEALAHATDRAEAGAVAAYTGANVALDRAITAFGHAQLKEAGEDRRSKVFTLFFPVAPSKLVRKPLAEVKETVRGWLTLAGFAALDRARTALLGGVERSDRALALRGNVGAQRGAYHLEKDKLTTALTRARDELHAELVTLGGHAGYERDWPDSFFLVASSSPTEKAPEPEATPPA